MHRNEINKNKNIDPQSRFRAKITGIKMVWSNLLSDEETAGS